MVPAPWIRKKGNYSNDRRTECMEINKETCIGCALCVNYCPMSCISIREGRSFIDQDECVECGVCKNSGVCPVDAIYEPEMDEKRNLRKTFSNPLISHSSTSVPGRGTEEMKTNDVTGRFKMGFTGIAAELGRPGTGTRFSDVQKVAQACARHKVEFEPLNPVTTIMTDRKKGLIDERFLNEKVLSAIVEFIVPDEKVKGVLEDLMKISNEIDTVFSLDICGVADASGKPFFEKVVQEMGLEFSINGKVNVGLGRPLAEVL